MSLPSARTIVYVDMDDVLCDFSGRFAQIKKEHPGVEYPQSLFDFFRTLPPLNGAIEGINQLIQSPQFDTYILTAPSVYNPMCYTEKRVWVEEHLGMRMVEKLIISPNKGLLKGDYLIDDHDEGRGQERFEGALLHFGSKDYPNWEAVLSFLFGKHKE